MECDRSWMLIKGIHGRQKEEYRKGVEGFLDFAFKDIIHDPNAKIRCPCLHCLNNFLLDKASVRRHLFQYGMDPGYDVWIYHGEGNSSTDDDNVDCSDGFVENDPLVSNDMASLVRDSTNVSFDHTTLNHESAQQGSSHQAEMPEKFKRLMKATEEELYQGCQTYSKLEFIVTLLNLKASNHWSDKSFTELLTTLHRAFNYDSSFPRSSFEAKKYTNDLGLNYEKIDVCVNHCVLFRKQYANATECPVCHEPRWQTRANDVNDANSCENVDEDPQKKSKVPRLVLRYFPLTTRLQRLFMSCKTAHHMRWHKDKCYNDNIIRHPRDSLAWKALDDYDPHFAADPRNVRLGLACDGFTPSTHLGTRYSIWPVFLVPYNLPPWMCMKTPYMMLSLLIPGPRSPGNDIDVFLEPLVEELVELWEVGAQAYDCHRKEMFNMRAALLWTINDFPAYGYLSGWSTCGKLACPSCHKGTCYVRLKYGFKQCFPGNCKFLEPDHRWRLDTNSFYGKTERGPPPTPLTGDEVLKALHGIPNVVFGKKEGLKRKRGTNYLDDQFKKISIFFRLPYWSKLLIRHNLDVMHVEKNICDTLLGTILDIPGKTKDNLNARKDLVRLNMHKKLQPIKEGDKYTIPRAPYQLSAQERKRVLEFISKVKVPDGYSSNVARCASLNEGRVVDMKSHDCHVFMQDLLTPTFRGILPKQVFQPLSELSSFFKQLCSKNLTIEAIEKLEKSIPITLCKLEKNFVPSFFTIMMHLPNHLASEAKIAGPVQFRSMWRFERQMRTMKSDVRNKARPEGSIAESYIQQECANFISMYLRRSQTKFDSKERNDMEIEEHEAFELSVFERKGKPLGKGDFVQLTHSDWQRAQLYILQNCPEVRPFLEEYEKLHHSKNNFVQCFQSQMWKLYVAGDARAKREMLSLSRGPTKTARIYQGYFINGYRFHTKQRQRRRKTQNSGVVVKGDEVSGERDFFGVLKEVLELEYDAPYSGGVEPKVVLFRCDWYDVYSDGRGVKRDKDGTISINTRRRLGTDEPFVIASQVGQVYYVGSHNEQHWRIVIKTIPRNFYYFPVGELSDHEEDDHDNSRFDVGEVNVVDDVEDDETLGPRIDVPSNIVSTTEYGGLEDDEEGEDESSTYEEEESMEESDFVDETSDEEDEDVQMLPLEDNSDSDDDSE